MFYPTKSHSVVETNSPQEFPRKLNIFPFIKMFEIPFKMLKKVKKWHDLDTLTYD